MKTKFLKFFAFIGILSFLSCEAQKPFPLNVQRAARGNTGLRGRVPDEAKDTPLKGNDFVELSLVSPTQCRIDSVFVTLKNPDVRLRDESQSYPKILKANDVMYVRVENIAPMPSHWQNNMRDTCEGFVEIFSHRKKHQIVITSFKQIIPK